MCSPQVVFISGYLAVVEHMMVGTDQAVRLLQLKQFVYLSGIDQTVAAHQRFIIRHRRHNLLIVKVAQLYETAAANIVQPKAADALRNIRIIGGHKHLYGVFARRFEGCLWSLAVGQQTAHGNDREDANCKAEEARYGCSEYVHCHTGLVFVESADNQVWRRADKSADTTHA